MKRQTIRIVTVVSLIAFLAFSALWLRSYSHYDGLSNDLFRGSQLRGGSGIWSMNGHLVFDTSRHVDVSRMPGISGWKFSTKPATADIQFVDYEPVTRFSFLGMRLARSLSPSGDGTTYENAAVAIPYWALASSAALLPIVIAARRLNSFRRSPRLLAGGSNAKERTVISSVPATA